MSGSIKIHGLLYKYNALDKSYKLNSPSPTERGELAVLQQINEYIVKLGKPITVKVGENIFKNIYGANKVEGTPKADIALVTFVEKTKKFEDVCFISHKMGKDAGSFQQYSGITDKADGKKSGSISKDKTVIEFLRTISQIQKVIVEKKERYYRVIKDKKLIGKAVYGPEFGSSKYTIDNIHVIGQGDVKFIKNGDTHTLEFTTHASYNPDVSEFMRHDYTAIIAARYTAGRNYQVDGKTYSGARILILPKKVIGGKAKEI